MLKSQTVEYHWTEGRQEEDHSLHHSLKHGYSEVSHTEFIGIYFQVTILQDRHCMTADLLSAVVKGPEMAQTLHH